MSDHDNQNRREHYGDYRRRQDDQIIPRIDQKLSDLIASMDAHVAWVKNVTKDHDDRISILERIKEKVEWPAKTIGWIIIITLGGTLAYFGQRLACFLEHHFR